MRGLLGLNLLEFTLGNWPVAFSVLLPNIEAASSSIVIIQGSRVITIQCQTPRGAIVPTINKIQNTFVLEIALSATRAIESKMLMPLKNRSLITRRTFLLIRISCFVVFINYSKSNSRYVYLEMWKLMLHLMRGGSKHPARVKNDLFPSVLQ